MCHLKKKKNLLNTVYIQYVTSYIYFFSIKKIHLVKLGNSKATIININITECKKNFEHVYEIMGSILTADTGFFQPLKYVFHKTTSTFYLCHTQSNKYIVSKTI